METVSFKKAQIPEAEQTELIPLTKYISLPPEKQHHTKSTQFFFYSFGHLRMDRWQPQISLFHLISFTMV